MKRLTTADFIKAAKDKHGDKYDYSKVKYINNNAKVTIICPVHGLFEQLPKTHFKGLGCTACSGRRKKTTEIFINEAVEVHGSKFDYSLVNYTTALTKVKIICPIHGVFQQKAVEHLKYGCAGCSGRSKSNTATFIKKAQKVHNSKYDYSRTHYSSSQDEVIIICKMHGVFSQRADKHLLGQGCRECAGTKPHTLKSFIDKARDLHGDKYDYSKAEYKSFSQKTTIICAEHGEFKQRPCNHLQGYGCKICARIDGANKKKRSSGLSFISKAIKTHGKRYNYKNAVYSSAYELVKLICPDHGEFEQTPLSHLQGRGCPSCASSKGEIKIDTYLKSLGVYFEREKRFDNCRHKLSLPFDFYLPESNLLIEFDGEQHFVPNIFFGGEKAFKDTLKRDNIKNAFAERHNIRLLRIKYTDFERIEEILSKELSLEAHPVQLSLFAA